MKITGKLIGGYIGEMVTIEPDPVDTGKLKEGNIVLLQTKILSIGEDQIVVDLGSCWVSKERIAYVVLSEEKPAIDWEWLKINMGGMNKTSALQRLISLVQSLTEKVEKLGGTK